MKISVTQEHIDKGERWNSERCPLALAFQSGGFDAAVSPDRVDFYNSDYEIVGTLRLPLSAQNFQYCFDGSRRCLPFEFEMPGLDSAFRIPHSDFVPVAVV